MQITLTTHMNQHSGYGNDGIGLSRALITRGHDVHLKPLSLNPPIPKDIAELLTKTPTGVSDLHIHHVDPASAECVRPSHSRLNILWTMHELPWWPEDPRLDSLHSRLSYFDLVIAYDTTSRDALALHTDETRLATVQGGFDPKPWKYITRPWQSHPLRCLMLGDAGPRKNPMAAIEAVDRANEDGYDVSLYVKASQPTPLTELTRPWLTVDASIQPRQKILDLYAASHVLLAPSLGEGKNVPALEFMTTGGVVIGSDCGGHQQWMRGEIGYTVKLEWFLEHKVVRVPVDQITNIIKHVDDNRHEAKQKGDLASRTIPAACSWDAALERLMAVLRARGASL